MNKEQLAKSVGVRLRLRPRPLTRQGTFTDDDWVLRRVESDRIELERVGGGGHIATLGLDQIYGFTSDPARESGGGEESRMRAREAAGGR